MENPVAEREETLRDFFQRYARVSLSAEPEHLADCYEPGFLAAGPGGGAVFRNDASFLQWLREVHAFNEASGMIALAPGAIREAPVGAGYTLVDVEWAAIFRRTGDTPIRFTISYLLRESGETLKIAAYISHEDQEEAMRAHGLL